MQRKKPQATASPTVKQATFDLLRAFGIRCVFGNPGSTGQLCFVSVEHLVTTARGLAIRERQDIVYRDVGGTPAASAKPAPPPVAQHRETHVSPAAVAG